jgi:hypothetical protein
VLDENRCTDCYVCIRNEVCRFGALQPGELPEFIDEFRHILSDPTTTTKETGVPGRGTEEAKTNDVSGRFRKGEAGFAIDMGRPGVGVSLRDVQTVAMAVAKAGLKLEGPNFTPLAKVMTNIETGELDPKVLDQFLLSIIIEGKCPVDKMGDILDALKSVEDKIDSVFSVGLILRTDENGCAPQLAELPKHGVKMPIRGKVNVGLGRPLATD